MQTDDAVYFTQGAEAGNVGQSESLWVYANGSAQRVSDLASNAVYDPAKGMIYFLLGDVAPRLMSLNTATGQIEAEAPDLKGIELTNPEIALEGGGLVIYSHSGSGVKTAAVALSLPSVPTATAALTRATAPTAEPSQNLSKGSKGEDVLSLQQRLVELGYPAGALDGRFWLQDLSGGALLPGCAGH